MVRNNDWFSGDPGGGGTLDVLAADAEVTEANNASGAAIVVDVPNKGIDNTVGTFRSHTTVERNSVQNKIPQKKMSADNECMKCRDVKNAYGNPGEWCPFSH